jgi:hypothetical protein
VTDFRYDATVADSYADLEAADIPERARETIARLGSDAECSAPFAAIHVPTWLLEKKSLAPIEGSDSVVYARIAQASEKAIEATHGGDTDWLPKSQIEVFHVDEGIETPTKTLDTWG